MHNNCYIWAHLGTSVNKPLPPPGRAGKRQRTVSVKEINEYVASLREEAKSGSVDARVALIEIGIKMLAEKKHDGR